MGKGSGGGTNTVTNSSAPPADVTAQYDNIIGQANTLSASPLNQYGGPQVAGFTPAQTAAFNTVNNSQGIQTPYLNNAQTMLQNSQTPIWNSAQQWSPNAVQQYENPYNTDVTNATMANINETNAQQNQQVVGNAISSGAWGGDRSAIAQSELARQQALASNQTLAGLNANNYNQAQTEFNQQQGAQIGANQSNDYLASQGAFGESSLGTAAQNSALTGANAQLNVGNQQQTLAQSALNIPYEQFLQQQAYPYQNLSWLSGLSTGMGSGEGGTSSTTSPGASLTSQLGGLATGVGGLLGSSGLFRSAGAGAGAGGAASAYSGLMGASGTYAAAEGPAYLPWLVDTAAARGGRVEAPRRKSGGFVPRYGMGGDIPNVDVSYFPEMKPSGGAGLNSLNSTSMGGTSTSTSSSDSGGGSTMDSILKLLPIAAEVAMAMNRGGVAKRRGFIPHYASGGDTTTLTGVPGSDVPYIPANLHLTRGMGIPQAPHPYDSGKNTNDIANEAKAISSIGKSVLGSGSNSSQNPQGFDDGGAIPNNSFSTTVTGSLAPQSQSAIASMGNMTDEQLREYAARTGSPLAKQMIQKRQMMPPGQQPAAQQQQSGFQQPQTFADGGMTDDNAAKMVQLYSDDDSDASVSQPTGLGPPAPPGPVAPQQQRGFVPPDSADMPHYDGAGADPINKPDPWLALAHAGFAMAAGQSPHALTNIGQGALAGVEDYQKQKEEAAKESQQQGTLKQAGESLYEQAKEKRAEMFNTAQHNEVTENQGQQDIDNTQSYRNKQIDLESRQKWKIDPNTGMPMNTFTGEMKNPYANNAPPVDANGNITSDIPDDYFGIMKPREIVDFNNVVKKNQPKDLQNQQAALASLVDQNTKINDLVKQIPIASHGDLHTLSDFVDRNQIPVFSDPKRGDATVAAAYDSLGNVLDNLKSTFSGTGRVLQAEFNTMKQEMNASANGSPEMKAAVVGRIQKRLGEVTQDQLQYTNDVSSGMAYMPSRIYQSPMEKRLQGLATEKTADAQVSQSTLPNGVTPDIARQHASDAIKAGAPRDAVIKRLQDSGVSTDGL